MNTLITWLRNAAFLALVLLSTLAQAQPNGTAERMALVIGNSAYPRGATLKNPIADATAVSRELEALGFKVTLVRDAGWKELQEEVREFTRRAEGSRMRLVFYAGHGAQIRGRNYLVPVDVSVADTDELVRKSVELSELVERLSRQPQAVNVVVLDACRNNPASNLALAADGRQLKTRGTAPGLARVSAPAGSLIAYSTAPGQVADDGANTRNSLYTKHLLQHLHTPGITLEQMFKRVRIGVMQDSANQQQPWEENSLSVDVCLKAGPQGRCPGS